jgi:hypothetical protein
LLAAGEGEELLLGESVGGEEDDDGEFGGGDFDGAGADGGADGYDVECVWEAEFF